MCLGCDPLREGRLVGMEDLQLWADLQIRLGDLLPVVSPSVHCTSLAACKALIGTLGASATILVLEC